MNDRNDEDITVNFHGGDEMSVDAEPSKQSKSLGQARIYSYIRAFGPATCEELEVKLDMPHQTCSARISELRRDKVLVEVDRAVNRSGRTARVHGINPKLLERKEGEGA